MAKAWQERRNKRRRRRIVAAAVGAAALLGAGVAAYFVLRPTPAEWIAQSDPLEVIAAAHEEMVDAATAGVDMTVHSEQIPSGADPSPAPVTYGGTGAYDFDAVQGEVTFDLSDAPPGSVGTLGGLGHFPTVFDPPDFIVRVDDLPEPVETNEPWVRFDQHSLVANDLDVGEIRKLQWADPGLLLSFLASEPANIERRETHLRQAHLTHYGLTADPSRVKAPQFEPVLDQLVEHFDVRVVPVDVWVDQQLRVERLRMSLQPRVSSELGARFTYRVDVTFSDHGEPVDISEPETANVTPINELID